MATFIVHFVDETARSFRGKARHVASGEESIFADEGALLAFFERMNVLGALARANAELVEAHAPPAGGPPESADDDEDR